MAQIAPEGLEPIRLNNTSKFNRVDIQFSLLGVYGRMVTSIFYNGILNKIIIDRGKKIAEEFFEELGE